MNVYAQSNLPLVTSSWLVAWLLAWAGKATVAGTILSACQYDGFFFSVYCVGLNEPSVYGPVATGLSLTYFTGSDTDDQVCWGTIGTWAIWLANGTFGALNVNVAVLPVA